MSATNWVDCGNGVRLERGVRCRMSDGVELFSDHYYPQRPGPNPTLLMRQPYGRDIASDRRLRPSDLVRPSRLQRRDPGCSGPGRFRGRVLSVPQRRPRRSGNDRLAAGRARMNGRIGMYGFSYQGMTQLLAAAEQPEGLMCIAPGMTAHDLYYGWFYHHGALRLASTSRLGTADAQGGRAPPQAARSERPPRTGLGQSPGANDVLPFGAASCHSRRNVPRYVLDWFDHDQPGEYWSSLDVSRAVSRSEFRRCTCPDGTTCISAAASTVFSP